MCTLILLDRVVPGLPIMVAANRDEYYARPSAPPSFWKPDSGALTYVAPSDLRAGGSWMGVNRAGVFVGLTNRPTTEKRADARSRGLLVLDALALDSAEAAAERLRADGLARHSPFNLVLADGRRSFRLGFDLVGESVEELPPGRHVVCNRDPGDRSSGKVLALAQKVAALELAAPPAKILAGLTDTLAAHPSASNPLENPCVHTAEYGTRSSTVLMLGAHGRGLWFADGPPCEAKYADHAALLERLYTRSPE